jgi:hypothetical protein
MSVTFPPEPTEVFTDGLTAWLSERWLDRADKRRSYYAPPSDVETVHVLVVEAIKVEPAKRREGRCRRYLEALLGRTEFELIVVEGVGNTLLAEALLRWGWDHDPRVMDFYHETTPCPS